MSRWFRFYDETLNDPKSLKLSDKTHRIWIGILCIASKNNGKLPPFEDIAIMLRVKPYKLQPEIEKLITAELIDHDDNGMRPHNWDKRQYKSDVSTERVKRFRNAERNVSETPPDTDTELDTERKKEKNGLPKNYAFESGIIRLNQKDLDQWKAAFKNLNLEAELIACAPWAAQQKSWFNAVSTLLGKKNREQATALERARVAPEKTRSTGII